MALIRPIPTRNTGVTPYHLQGALQTAVTYTADNEQDIVIFCRIDNYAGTSTIKVNETTLYSTDAATMYASDASVHLSAGDVVTASGNATIYMFIATNGTGTIA
jgi:hypothetical protein